MEKGELYGQVGVKGKEKGSFENKRGEKRCHRLLDAKAGRLLNAERKTKHISPSTRRPS
jgi:hypothetical protein